MEIELIKRSIRLDRQRLQDTSSDVLKSLKECILEQDIDTKYLYMRW